MPVAALLTAFAGFVFMVTAVYALLRPAYQVARPDCDTNDCFQHAYMLVSGLNRSIDPCEDFGAYVCSAWLTTSIYSFNTQQDRWHQWIQASGQLLGYPRVRRHEAAIVRAVELFHLCVNLNATTSRDNLAVLRDFMRARKLVIQDGDSKPKAHPLDVLLDLAINWQMPFWFDVRVLRTGSILGVLIRSGHYEVFWEEAVETFITESSGHELEDGGRVRGARSTNASGEFFTDSTILAALREVAKGVNVARPLAIRITDIANITPSVNAEQWLSFLSKHLAPTFRVTTNDQILLSDKNLLVTVNRLLETYVQEDLLAHIARLVNRTFSNLINTRLKSSIYNDISPLSPLTNISYACQVQVEDTFKLPIAMRHIMQKKLDQHRSAIDHLIGDVIKAAISLLYSNSWMSNELKEVAIKRMREATVRFWPRDQLMNDDELTKLYNHFPSGSKIYFDELLLVRNATRATLGTPTYEDLTDMPHGGRDPYFTYDTFNNSFTLAVGAAMPPLFYTAAIKSINYGGMASLLAAQVVRSMNVPSVSMDAAAGWTVSSPDKFPTRPPCSDDAGGRSAYPDVASIQVAHRAYRGSLAQDGQSHDVRVRSLEEFTGEQLFFLSFCRNTCHLEHGSKMSKMCNAALRDFEPFAAAFHCSKGSAMNPDRKCTFFN
ncbi:hypothetical protein V5799_020756 [Amblyomma americanum]|uniref:M13 family peptidase n=1 Tax=Amblyomma americanum TaxID=6943 RepID=A0AAQ4ET74_AMBAM